MLQIAICDESKADTDALKVMIEKVMEEYHVRYNIETYNSGAELVAATSLFNLIFLDVTVDDGKGIEIGRKLYRKYQSKVIFHTRAQHYQEAAMNKSHAFACLKKPIERAELAEQIWDFLSLQDNIQSVWMEFRHIHYVSENQEKQKEAIRVMLKDILYFESRQREKRTNVVTENGVFICLDTISSLEKRISFCGFEICNRGILVNIDKISRIKGHGIILRNGDRVPLSQRRASEFKKRVDEFTNAFLKKLHKQQLKNRAWMCSIFLNCIKYHPDVNKNVYMGQKLITLN